MNTERIELIRLLHQRYQDLGDTLARKAAWAIEELSDTNDKLVKALDNVIWDTIT